MINSFARIRKIHFLLGFLLLGLIVAYPLVAYTYISANLPSSPQVNLEPAPIEPRHSELMGATIALAGISFIVPKEFIASDTKSPMVFKDKNSRRQIHFDSIGTTESFSLKAVTRAKPSNFRPLLFFSQEQRQLAKMLVLKDFLYSGAERIYEFETGKGYAVLVEMPPEKVSRIEIETGGKWSHTISFLYLAPDEIRSIASSLKID